jgi:photosystem II stability/assembly factor-like uncharacterized protein
MQGTCREASVKYIWHPTTATIQGRHDDIWFISPDIGWAVNSAGKIIHTKDGGKSWANQRVDPVELPNTYLRCMSFSGPTDGWVGAIRGRRIRRTQDGVNWVAIPEESLPRRPGRVCGICAASKDVVYASGTQNPDEDNTGVMRTTDGGRSWSELPIGDRANLLIDIYFTDEMHGWVVGGRGGQSYDRLKPVVLYTADGGTTWQDRLEGSGIQFPRGEWGWKIQFLNDRLGFVSLENFQDAAILKTTDGGRTWQRKEIKNQQGKTINQDLEGIGFINETIGWVGGHGFRLPGGRSETSSGTTDGGSSWFEATNEVGKNINRFRFTGTQPIVGYASGVTIYQCEETVSAAQEKTLVASAKSFAEMVESEIPLVTNAVEISTHVPEGTKQLTISIWNQRQLLIKTLVDEKNPAPGARSVSWDFTTPDGGDAGTGDFIYRINIDDHAESKMVYRPLSGSAEELATQVAKMIKARAGDAAKGHDDLILPDASGKPRPLLSLFDDPKELMAGLVHGGWVVPHHPERSMLLVSIIGTDSNLGPMQQVFSKENIQLLNDWIAAGAAIPSANP